MPIAAAGIALAAAGTAMSIEANNQDQSAISAAESKAVNQEKRFESQGKQVFQQALPKSAAQTAQQEIAQGAATRKNVFNQLQQLGQPLSPTISPNAGNPTQQAMARSAQTGNVFANLNAGAQGRVGGVGDWGTALGVTNADVGNRLGVINTEARGTANLLPLEVQVASHSGDALSGWGKIVGALGSLAMAGAGSGTGTGENAMGYTSMD